MEPGDSDRSGSDPSSKSSPAGKRKDTKKNPLINFKWSGRIVLITLVTSFCLSYFSERVLDGVNYIAAVIILILVVSLGILFDMLGTAVTTADEKVINSMASRKIRGAKLALYFVSHAASVSNFCNDVVGDICGIISGSMCVVISAGISGQDGGGALLITVAVTAVTAAATVGGKSLGKSVAIFYSTDIVHFVSRMCCIFTSDRK